MTPAPQVVVIVDGTSWWIYVAYWAALMAGLVCGTLLAAWIAGRR